MKKQVVLQIVLILIGLTRPSQAFDPDHVWESLEIHGFISQGFLKSAGNNFYADTKDGTFQFNEVGLNFGVDLSDRLHTTLQFLSRDIGDIGNNAIQLDLAFADYRWRDWLGLRVGKLKINYGLYNETRDIDLLRTSVLLPQSLYSEIWRDMLNSLYGVEIYGNLSLGIFGRLSYQYQQGQKDITGDSALIKLFRETEAESEIGFELEKFKLCNIFAFSFDWETPLEGLHVKNWLGEYEFDATLKYTAPIIVDEVVVIPAGTEQPIELEDTERLFLSIEYIRDNLTLATELHIEATEENAYVARYIGAAYRFTNWLEIGCYYSESREYQIEEENEEEPFKLEKGSETSDFVVTTRFDINPQWTLKVEGHVVKGTGGFFLQDNPDGVKDESFLFAVKTTFNF